ncbi:hypothetical protein COOONC_01410, partial [Cooperia oncophora]
LFYCYSSYCQSFPILKVLYCSDDSLDLLDTIAETQITLNLFLNNKFDLAEERMVQLADRSMYHALGHNTIVFIKAMMTCDKVRTAWNTKRIHHHIS